ncbi:hypothetical protein EDB80DRAFT_717902 [Ilyonectria destructans]|nr:hypothetical protein EDB80DRAFT_717902 [Ilyonectria destructans]
MRPLSACLACRERRKRCERPRRGTSCKFCITRKLECSMSPKLDAESDKAYGLLKHHRIDTNLSSASAGPFSEDLSEEMVGLYFQYIQGGFPSLFHEPSFMADVRDGTVPLILFYGVIGLSARFSRHPSLSNIDPWERGRPYAKEAERLLDLHVVSLTTIQACMLLGLNFVVEGESRTECVYFAIASRMALLLDLPNALAKTPLEQEINRRVWWSIVTTDTWNSGSLCLPRAVNPQDSDPLPVDEWTFAEMSPAAPFITDPSDDGRLSQTAEPSLSALARLVKLNKLLYEIYKLNATIVDERLQIDSVESLIESQSASLEEWLSELPCRMQYTEANMSYWAEQGFGRIFLTLHINYNHAAQLLFYQFLDFSQAANGGYSLVSAQAYADKCKQHAATLCELIYQAREQHGIDLRYTLIGHVLVMTSTVQIHSLLFSLDENKIAHAKVRLERNFEMITRLHTYWPTVSASFSRLRAFHSACLKSRHSPFRLDRWMLRFMLEFSRPIAERDVEVAADPEDSKPFHQLKYLIDP